MLNDVRKVVALWLVVLIIVGAITAMTLVTSCSSTMNFKKKALAAEIKVYGIEAEVPSTTFEESIAKIRLGVITSRYISAPDGGKASIETEYNDINFWTLSGSAKSKLSVSNNCDVDSSIK